MKAFELPKARRWSRWKSKSSTIAILANSAGHPASPKKRYRSEYVYPWRSALADPDQVLAWKGLSDFDLALRLVDFSGLRPVLAQLLGWKSGRGWEPFDPVSFFLLTAWQIANHWSAVTNASKTWRIQRYADYAVWFGFHNGGLSHRRGRTLLPDQPWDAIQTPSMKASQWNKARRSSRWKSKS